MKISNVISSLMILVALILFGCQDQLKPSANSASQGEMVSTPFGMMSMANVHFLNSNHTVSLENGRMQVINASTGAIVADYGEVKNTPKAMSKSVANPQILSTQTANGAMASGNICMVFWDNYAPNYIPSFTSNLTVPAPPTTNSGQSLYIFQGYEDYGPGYPIPMIDPHNTVVTPVLQWGTSGAGGGNYWSIATWVHIYVDGGANDQALYSSLVQVSPGTVLQPTVSYSQPNFYSWTGSFAGYPQTSRSLTIAVPPHLIQMGMTANHMTQFSDYPPGLYLNVNSILMANQVFNGNQWQVANIASDPGLLQEAVVVPNYNINYSPWNINLYFNSASSSNSCQYTSLTTLTFSYQGGEFDVVSDHPIDDNLILGGIVYGYSSMNCSGPVLDFDNLTGSFAACTTSYSIAPNGLSCIDKSFKFPNVIINGTHYTNGQTAIINGHSYKIVIENSTCSVYPC